MGSQAQGNPQGQMGPPQPGGADPMAAMQAQQMGPPPPPPQAMQAPGAGAPPGGKPGGPPGQGQQGRMQEMMGQMAGQPGAATAMPVSDPSQLPQIGDQMVQAGGPGGPPPQGGKPGGPPGGTQTPGGMGNPNASDQQAQFGGMPGGPGGPPPDMYPGMNAPNQNRWGPGMSAGPGIPGPYAKMDPNSYLLQRPEGFNQSLIDVAEKSKIAPHERTAQSYGESYTREPVKKKKKGGK